MKIRFPKQIIVGDSVFKVVKNPKIGGGSFEYWQKKNKKTTGGVLTIGTFHLKHSPLRVWGTIIHELKEIIQIEQGTRYERPDNQDEYEFHYTHKEHTDLCSRLAGLLNEFLK